MEGVALYPCPEVEQLRPCVMFGKGVCPDCYAEPLLKLRLATSRARRARPGHGHARTEDGGVVRLGTYREILPDDFAAFKAGEGVWDCCGKRWSRPDFRTRPFFLITRGLLPVSFYERVAADPACVNVQVSTDLSPEGTATPPEDRLLDLSRIGKVIFRAKSSPKNAALWGPLFDRLEVARGRVMETPLRSRVLETKLAEGHFAYGRDTLLQQSGWKAGEFLRCNTACHDCVKENGVLACVVRPATLARLGPGREIRPPRHTLALHDLSWADEARRALAELGGRATVPEVYAWFERRHPELVVGKPSWRFKVRVALQRAAVPVVRGVWRLRETPLTAYADPAVTPPLSAR